MQTLRLVAAEAKVERKDKTAKVRRDKRRTLKIQDPRLRASSINKKEVADPERDALSNIQSCRNKRSEILFVLDRPDVSRHRIRQQQETDDRQLKVLEQSNTAFPFSIRERAKMERVVNFPI